MKSEDMVLLLGAQVHELDDILEVGFARKLVVEKVVVLLHHYSEVLIDVGKSLVLGNLGDISEVLLDM